MKVSERVGESKTWVYGRLHDMSAGGADEILGHLEVSVINDPPNYEHVRRITTSYIETLIRRSRTQPFLCFQDF